MNILGELWGAIVVFLLIILLGLVILIVANLYLKKNHAKKRLKLTKINNSFLLAFISLGFFKGLNVLYYVNPAFILLARSLSLIAGTYALYLILNKLIKLWKDYWGKDERLKLRLESIVITSRVVKIILIVGCAILILETWYISTFPFFMSFIDFINYNIFTKTLIIFVFYVVIARTILYICKTYISEAIKKHEEGFGDIILENIEYPISWIIIFYGIKMSLIYVNFTSLFLIPVINSFIIVMIMHTFVKLTDITVEFWDKKWLKRTKSTFNDEVVIIIHNISKVIIIVVGTLLVLGVWGVQIESVLISLGVLGVIVGFALKDSLDNLVGGISLILDRSFKTGDIIKLKEGEMGEVIDIGLRSTKIRTLDNELLVVPNSQLSNTEFTNYAKPNNHLRIKIPINVQYGSDVDKVKKVLKSCVKKIEEIKDQTRTEVRFMEMGDYALEFQLLFYIDNYKDRFKVRNKVTTKVYKELNKKRIVVPFPTRIIHMQEDGKKRVVKKVSTINKPKRKVIKKRTTKKTVKRKSRK